MDIEEHYGLVGWVIDRYFTSFIDRYPSLSYEDLFNEGVIALIESASKFDESLGNKFSTYAIWGIHNNLEQYIEKNIRLVTFSYKTPQLDRQTKHLDNMEEIQKQFNLTDRDIKELDSYRSNSYRTELNIDIMTDTVDNIPSARWLDFKDIYDQETNENKIILFMRIQGYTLREIGQEIGLSHTTISNRIDKIKNKVFE